MLHAASRPGPRPCAHPPAGGLRGGSLPSCDPLSRARRRSRPHRPSRRACPRRPLAAPRPAARRPSRAHTATSPSTTARRARLRSRRAARPRQQHMRRLLRAPTQAAPAAAWARPRRPRRPLLRGCRPRRARGRRRAVRPGAGAAPGSSRTGMGSSPTPTARRRTSRAVHEHPAPMLSRTITLSKAAAAAMGGSPWGAGAAGGVVPWPAAAAAAALVPAGEARQHGRRLLQPWTGIESAAGAGAGTRSHRHVLGGSAQCVPPCVATTCDLQRSEVPRAYPSTRRGLALAVPCNFDTLLSSAQLRLCSRRVAGSQRKCCCAVTGSWSCCPPLPSQRGTIAGRWARAGR
jgi:hypothetical protein